MIGDLSTDFGILDFTTEEILELSDFEKEFIFSASLIINDIRFHWSLIARTGIDSDCEDIKNMQMARNIWCLRKLSSVIYEADIQLNKIIGNIYYLKEKRENGRIVLPKGDNYSKYKELAGKLRNKTSYHYSVSELTQNIRNFGANAKHIYYVHMQQGNSISIICEQVISGPTILGAFKGASLEGFHNWCANCSNSVLKFCNVSIVDVCSMRFPTKKIKMRELLTGSEAKPRNHRWPLFMATE
jgi:hypothetical protein